MASDHDVTSHQPSNNINSSTIPDRNSTRNLQSHSTSNSSQTSSSDVHHTGSKPASKYAHIIYTPASTVTSSKGSSACDEIVADTLEAAGWPEEWCQLRTFASDIGQIKELLSRQSTDDEANDLSRLKQNHRSSLASLAELHRTEIAGLNSAHSEAMRKLELQHLQELKDARRNHGHDRDLVRGLHESYGKQIECLVLDLGEARREIQELKLSQPMGATSVAETEANAEAELQKRRLQVRLKFEELEGPLGTTEIWVPHPGKSFDKLLEAVTCAAIHHLKAVKQTANFFLYRLFRDEHRDAALNINKWEMAVDANKITLHFPWTPMNVRWEEEEWAKEDLMLDIRCSYEDFETPEFDIPRSPYEDGSEQPESRDDGRTSSMASSSTASLIGKRSDGSRKDASTPTNRRERYTAKDLLEQLEPAEMQQPPHDMAHIEAEFNSFGPAAHHQHLASESEADPIASSEEVDKENRDPRGAQRIPPKVTMEEVRDEDAPPSPVRVAPATKAVPILSVPQPKPRSASPLKEEIIPDAGVPLEWNEPKSQPKVRPPTLTKESTALLTELLEEHSRESETGSRMEHSMTNSFLAEDLFASSADLGAKPSGVGVEVEDQSDPAPLLQSPFGERQTGFSPLLGGLPNSSREPLIGNNRAMNEHKWRPMSVSDRKPTPFARRMDDTNSPPPKPFLPNGLSRELPSRPPLFAPSEFLSDNEGDDEETSQADTEVKHSPRGVTPTIGHVHGGTPPPAPEVNRQDTPTIPEYASRDMSEFNGDVSGDEDGISPSTQANSRNPFSNAHSTDIPASPSSASEAPLLNQGGSGRKMNHSPHHHRGLTNNTHTTNESRGPPPPAPCANSPEQRNSSRTKRSPRRGGYEPTEGDLSTTYQGEGGWRSCGSEHEYGPEYAPGGMPYNPPAQYHDRPDSPSSHSGSDSSDDDGYYDEQPGQVFGHRFGPHHRQIVPLNARAHTFPAGQFLPFPTEQAKMIFQHSYHQQHYVGLPPPRSSTAPFSNPATVFAPNPPNLTQRPSLQQLNPAPYPNENSGPLPGRFPWGNNHPSLPRLPGPPQRGYSSDALGPMIWNTGDIPVMPHGHSPSSSNHDPALIPGLMGPWGSFPGQGSPASAQSGMHPPQAIPQWYSQPRPMQSQEFQGWNNSPMSMPMTGWGSGYSG